MGTFHSYLAELRFLTTSVLTISPRFCMPWLYLPMSMRITHVSHYTEDIGFYCKRDGWESRCSSSLPSRLTREFFFSYFILHVYLIVFTLRTMIALSVVEEIYSLGTIFLSCFVITLF